MYACLFAARAIVETGGIGLCTHSPREPDSSDGSRTRSAQHVARLSYFFRRAFCRRSVIIQTYCMRRGRSHVARLLHWHTRPT